MKARLHLPNKPTNPELIQNTVKRLLSIGKPPAPKPPRIRAGSAVERQAANEKEKPQG